VVRRSPDQFGQKGQRWQLSTCRAACSWLNQMTLSGVWRLLRRQKIHLKRGRDHLHSPDPDYAEKLSDIALCLQQVRNQGPGPPTEVLVLEDEMSFYRQPSLGKDYELAGPVQPLAHRSLAPNRVCREVGVLNAVTGQVSHRQRSKIGTQQLVSFFEQVCRDYPTAKKIYMVVDNWPVHFHPDVLAALEPQQTRWKPKLPPSWSRRCWSAQPSTKARRLNLPIQLIPLPTYAPWTNPIEKLWRKLRQEVLHLHRKADQWESLKQQVAEFLDQFREGSCELLRYVGLTANSKLYGSLFTPQPQPP
jgi:DDE superfamily endonuclease